MVYSYPVKMNSERLLRPGTEEDADEDILHRAAAAADLKNRINMLSIKSGQLIIQHRHRECGLQAATYSAEIPFTAHPMFGHDIIYTHPMNCGACHRQDCRT